MTHTTHDTLNCLEKGTPKFFTLAALGLPAMIGIQFILAGQALFNGASWGLHGIFGSLVSIPILTLLIGSLVVRRLHGFGWWAAVLTLLYVAQVALAAGLGSAALALHPVNAALLLMASLVMFTKIQRRRDNSAIAQQRAATGFGGPDR